MDFLIFTEPQQGAAYDDLLRVARCAEDSAGQPRERLSEGGLVGSPAEVVDRLGQWREQTGITRVYLQLYDLADLDQIELVAAEIMPQLR